MLNEFWKQAIRKFIEQPGQRQEPSHAPPVLPPQLHVWDDQRRILALSDIERGFADDWLLLKNLKCGLSVMAAIGSGKTSALAPLALALMLLRCGFVWMCAKPAEVHLVRRIAARAKREKDVRVIGLDVDGKITPWRFNPLDYEAGTEAGTGAVVKYLAECHRVLSRKEGEREHSGGGSSRFWDTQFERILRYCIDTAKFAGRHLSIDLLRDIQLSAPQNVEQLASDAWASKSTCWQCLLQAETRADRGEVPRIDHDRILNFWTRDYLGLDQKPRSTIDVMFAALVDSFYAEEPLRSILTTETNVTPDGVINDGLIVVLSLPTSIFHEAGRMAQFCFKYSYQRAMLRRKEPADGSPMRPSVCWIDEAHRFAHLFDSTYFNEVRDKAGINVYIEQGIGGYLDALGKENKDEIDRFMQGLACKVFFQSDSHLSNTFAADVIGKRMLAKETDSWSQHDDGTTGGGSETTEERYQVLPGQFSELRRGGIENNRIVEGYVTVAGTVFKATGRNYMKCGFPQTELTK